MTLTKSNDSNIKNALMGLKFNRQKPKNIFISFFFRLNQILPLSHKKKLKLYLNLEWVFNYLVNMNAFRFYKLENHPARIHTIQFILKHLSTSHHVLDLGCKYGEMSSVLAQKARKVTGIDHDDKAIDLANKTYKTENLFFIHDDAFNYLKNNQEKFDVLILSHILEHLDDPKNLILKFRNYFDYLFIELPDFEMSYLNQYRKDLKMPLVYTDNDHIWEFDREEMKKLIEESNLQIIEAEYRFGVQKYWCAVRK